jgi:hypothetical protein
MGQIYSQGTLTIPNGLSVQPAPEFKAPKFLLVTRVYSAACYSNASYPPGPTVCTGWYFEYRAFDSLESLMKQLNENYSRYSQDSIVTVFRLDDKSEVKITRKQVQKVIPKHVDEQKWEETEWSAKP